MKYKIKMKVLVLILASDNNPIYQKYEEQWRRFMNLNPSFECYFYKGTAGIQEAYELRKNCLHIKIGECPGNILEKTFMALKYFEPRFSEFDYISRPNMSSFFLFDRYLKYLEGLPREKMMEGYFMHSYGYTYPSGCGFTFSKDVAQTILASRQGQYYMDDVTIGKICSDNNIAILTRDLIVIHQDNYEKVLQTLEDKPSLFHLRVNSGNNRSNDTAVYKKLVDHYYGTV
jgi:hypothetical protein